MKTFEKIREEIEEQFETLEEISGEIGLQVWQERTATCIHFGSVDCDYVKSGSPEICVQCEYFNK